MLVDWKDDKGRWFKMAVPDDAPSEQWGYGNPVGPPDLTDLGLPEDLMVRVHNQLFSRGLFTARDAAARRIDIIGAWQAALASDVQSIVDVYGRIEQPVVLKIEHPSAIDQNQQLVARAARRQRN